MKKLVCLLSIAAGMMSAPVCAQKLKQGLDSMYYEKFAAARGIFTALVAAEPANEEAVYWLGQSMIRPDDVTSADLEQAKTLYQSKLSVSNSQLLMAGIGHVELMQGKVEDARNHFEAAISLSQGKNGQVLNAIGFAHGNPDAKNGDAIYAIDKLTQATQLKKSATDPDVWVNLGDAHRKNSNGGEALKAYNQALAIHPGYARANYRIGKMYQSQGRSQELLFMDYFDKAIAADPAYAPVYSNLFNYYYKTNVTKAADYFDKWLHHSEKNYKTCYYTAALKYAQGFFMEAVSQADQCIAADPNNPYPNLYGLKANAFDRLKDSVKAVENYAEYFKRQSPQNITSEDYIEYVQNLMKIPGNETQAGLFLEKVLVMDTLEANRVQYIKSMGQALEARKKYRDAAEWYKRILVIKRNPGKVDLYNAGYNFYRGGVFDSSLIYLNQYAQKYPDDIFGHFMSGKASTAIDTTLQLGMANPHFERTIQIGLTDTVKYKSQLMVCYKYFVAYQANVMKDKAAALTYVDKVLSLDPNDAEAQSFRTALTTSRTPAGQKPKAPANKPRR